MIRLTKKSAFCLPSLLLCQNTTQSYANNVYCLCGLKYNINIPRINSTNGLIILKILIIKLVNITLFLTILWIFIGNYMSTKFCLPTLLVVTAECVNSCCLVTFELFLVCDLMDIYVDFWREFIYFCFII